MATIAATSIAGSGIKNVAVTTLNGSSDTFTYTAGAILVLQNTTGSPITATIDGSGATTVPVDGVGDVTISAGYSTGAIADGTTKVIVLDTIRKYLAGTIAITSGNGLDAMLLVP